MNMGIQVSAGVSAFNSLGHRPQSGIAGSHSHSTLNHFEEPPCCFPQRLHYFAFSPAMDEGSGRCLWLVLGGETTLLKSPVHREGTGWYLFLSHFPLYPVFILCWIALKNKFFLSFFFFSFTKSYHSSPTLEVFQSLKDFGGTSWHWESCTAPPRAVSYNSTSPACQTQGKGGRRRGVQPFA